MRDRLVPGASERTEEPVRKPAPPAADQIARLQASAGNHAVSGMIARFWGIPMIAGPTPATHAKTSPAEEYSGILHKEVDLLANAKAVVAFLRAKRGTPGPGSPAVTVTAAEIFADAALVKKLKPKPKVDADTQPTLDLLVYYGVLTAGGGSYQGVIDAKTNDLATARLDKATGDITTITKDFDDRAAKKDSVDPIGLTRLLDPALAAGSAGEKKEDKDAQTAVTDVEGRLKEFVVLRTPDGKGKARAPITRVTVDKLPAATPNAKGVDMVAIPVAGQSKPVELAASEVAGIEAVETGASADTVKLREGLGEKLRKARKRLARAQGYRTFAIEVVDFLERLRTRNTTWVGGTYPRHSWGEFSVDIFLNVGETAQGFYKADKTEQFFDDLNDTALEDGPFGTFQWRAVYNDTGMQRTVAGKYGANRISSAPHHGPSPDKLHIHLDVRPDKLEPDPVTGFRVNKSGRVEPF